MVACALRLPSSVSGCGVGCGHACWGLGFGCTRPQLGGCWGVCVLVRASRVVSCTSWFGVLCGGACLCACPACSPPFLAGVCCVGLRAGPGSRLCPALLGWVVGVCLFFLARLALALWCRWLAVPVPGLVVPVPPSPLFRAGLLPLFFLFQRGVCLRVSGVPFPGGPLFLAWCCRFLLGAPPVLLWGSCLFCFLVGGFGRLLWFWRAVWRLRAVLSPPPPSPPPISFGGGVCLFPPLPSLGWRTHWPAFSVVLRVADGGCVLLGRVPAPWVGWVMYTLGLAPLPAGLGPGSAGSAAAPGGFVWLCVRGLGLSVSFLLRGAGFNLLGGPPPLLPGARWPRVWPALLVCCVLVRRLAGCAVAGFA